MESLRQIIPLVLVGSLAGLILTVGMRATWSDVTYMFRRPFHLLEAVLAVNVIPPLAAMLLISLFPLAPVVKVGILLMAVSPVPPLVPGKQLKVGGAVGYSYGLYIAMVLLSVVIVPVTVEILERLYGRDVALPPFAVARNVLLTVLLPLGIGLGLHKAFPSFSERAGAVIEKIATVMLVLAVVPLLIGVWPAMMDLLGNGAGVAMALTCAAAAAGGHLLGGPEFSERATLAVTAATRHPGLALMIAGVVTDDRRVQAAVLLFMVIGIVAMIPYQIWAKRRPTLRAAAP